MEGLHSRNELIQAPSANVFEDFDGNVGVVPLQVALLGIFFKRAAVAWAKSTNFEFGSPLHGSVARVFSTWLFVNASGIKLASALAPSEISAPHEEHHMELPPAVAFWSCEDRAAMSITRQE